MSILPPRFRSYDASNQRFFGEVLGEPVGDAAAFDFSLFSPDLALVIGPSLTVFASSEPSTFFQYEPLTSSFSTMSFIVAAFAPFVTTVLSVTLKARDFSLPLIVNVFAF